ncbi:MAG: hypothetical protein ACEQSX_18465, partial [Baekduiaceae bacterium]
RPPPPPPPDRSGTYALTGRVAWVEPKSELVVLRVDATNRRARAFRGQAVTVRLAGARLRAPDRDADGQRTAADLLPGERVTVRANLPRRLARVPQVVTASSLEAHDHRP